MAALAFGRGTITFWQLGSTELTLLYRVFMGFYLTLIYKSTFGNPHRPGYKSVMLDYYNLW